METTDIGGVKGELKAEVNQERGGDLPGLGYMVGNHRVTIGKSPATSISRAFGSTPQFAFLPPK